MPPINMPTPHGDTRYKCGTCKWFYVGFKGNTCRQTREVLQTTQACIEYSPYKNPMLIQLSTDKVLNEMEKTIQSFSPVFLEKVDKELDSYFILKAKLEASLPDMIEEEKMKQLAHAFETCQAYTDRVVELKSQLGKKRAELDSLIKDTQAYLFSHYADYVKSLKNDSERQSFYRHAMPKLSYAIDQIDSVLLKSDLIHSNLKDTHYSMCRTQDGLIEIWKARVHQLDSSQRSRI